ncbi:hypothetical protein WICMUC_000945 [Wickerhamomyces mucosus]|uniref:U3 small nucleolar RNA-associated protein 20 n=1 Tax=Wickerhamomyces mucosus TaxID=1378264 RepID=A0A9P8PXR3_9ASCO|nr:hypothetical protein WICMUC_000945 [Wickerhamomyces mucosus]
MPKIKTTKSSKRFTYQSFRDRVDSIKIEPSRRLNKRAFDEAETSHFLSSIERWKEFNRSAVFTDFFDVVEPLSQSLPQILHYKQEIFQHLVTHIEKHDSLSLQPLLEALTQFCHDLGPDYMEFYEKTLELLKDAALDKNNTSDTLEWEFNSLAFMFKYLSRYLSKELIPTFKSLLPLFDSKEHISRFAAEALSFLLRKSAEEELEKVTRFVFNNSNKNGDNSRGIIVLYSESMKSTKGSIHSKSSLIIRALLGQISSSNSASIFCDILLNVIGFGTVESVESLYPLVLDQLSNKLNKEPDFMQNYLKILITLMFAESGKKVTDWSVITKSLNDLFCKEIIKEDEKVLLVQLLSIYIRNCDIETLTKFHPTLYKFAVSSLGVYFLPFISLSTELTRERSLRYSSPFLQDYINKQWNSHPQSVAYFIQEFSNKELLTKTEERGKFKMFVPSICTEKLYGDLETINIESSKDLYDIYWRLVLISYSSTRNKEVLQSLKIRIEDLDVSSRFKDTIISQVIASLDDSTIYESKFEQLYSNLDFIKSAKTINLSEELVLLASNNLVSANHDLKLHTLELIKTYTKDEDLVNLTNQCIIIEQIPLTLATGRDIQIRIRNLASTFRNLDNKTDIRSNVFFKFLFGLLTVKFSPAWEGVFEVLPTVLTYNEGLVWSLVYKFIENSDYTDEFIDFIADDHEVELNDWQILDPRLETIISNSKETIRSYINQQSSLLLDAEEKYSIKGYPEFMRSQALKVLKNSISIGEKHSSELVSILLDISQDNDTELEDVEEDYDHEISEEPSENKIVKKSQIKFSGKEIVSLLEIFASFRKLRKISRADELYSRCLTFLSTRTPAFRKVALNVLLNFNNQHINKYKDNLSNLLDDATFRDEITKLLSQNGTDGAVIEPEDSGYVMDLVLRILFGRIQNNNTSGNKKGIKSASISILANLEAKYIDQFLEIISEKITKKYHESNNNSSASAEFLRTCLGYSNALTNVINTLGEKFKDSLTKTIKPLIFTLLVAQTSISAPSGDSQAQSAARNVRQVGFKNLLLLFNLLTEYSWDEHIENIYERLLSPRFSSFEDENLQQVSALLRIIVSWSEHKSYNELLLINNLEPAQKVLSLLNNHHAKNEVITEVIGFSRNVIRSIKNSSKYQKLKTFVAQSGFDALPGVLERTSDSLVNSKAIDLLLELVENGYVETQERRNNLVGLSTQLLEKPSAQLSKESRLQILTLLKTLIKDFQGEFLQIKGLYEVLSKFLKVFTDRQQRELLVDLFTEFGAKFVSYKKVSELITDMNAYSKRSMGEYDYDTRLAAYRKINDTYYSSLSDLEWLPILNNSLYFVNDENDLSIRSNSSFTLRRFVDSLKGERENTRIFKSLMLPALRVGLRSKFEVVQTEFIALLAHIVEHVTEVDDFKDMQVLLFNKDEEANFFLNINHIQLHRRQRAIKRLAEFSSTISGSNIAHYLLPMIEHYAFVSDEKLRNISNETNDAIEKLIGYVSYKQFMAIYKRYLSGLKEGSETIRDSVRLMVTISKALLKNIKNNEIEISGFPSDVFVRDSQIENEMIIPISKILNKRNEETIIFRTPLIEALSAYIMCLSHERVVSVLPGVLTNICQILRSRSDGLRDSTRKHLSRAAGIIGAKYTRFIISELKSALTRGFQVHVLGFTVHTILISMQFQHGELDQSARLLMDIIMENLFGSTGQEKEADGYRTSMKEVKNNKSFEIAEILSRYLSLSEFNAIISPIKMLLQERITLKIQNKLDELIRRLSLGLYKNPQIADHEMLVLCYELFNESEKGVVPRSKIEEKNPSQEHFLVQLNSKPLRVETENKIYVETFQKLSLDLLRTTLVKNSKFMNSGDLSGFLPFFETALKSESEGVISIILRVLGSIIGVTFNAEIDVFKTCARRCLNIIKNSPSTESELVQACFKYLSSVIRQREDLSLKESSLGYLLIRIQPDINEQSRQGLAFNFLKALIAKHVMIPEVYDTMDKIREVMVTSHSKERRDMSRSIYFQFIMEYDQGRGRLEKQFKFLVDNLGYPAESGKQSVMEFIHLILQKAGPQLLEALASSFFVGLARVLISETSIKGKEMAVTLITTIFEKLGTESFEKYISGWMNSQNSALLRCSLQLYGIKLKVSGLCGELDNEVLINIKNVLENSKSSSEVSVQWELLYSVLNCLSILVDKDHNLVDEVLKKNIISTLLFPHSWIRLSSTRLVNILISKEIFNSSDIQNISYRLFHQLRAPSVDEGLSSQSVKFLTKCLVFWEKSNVTFDNSLKIVEGEEDEDDDDDENNKPGLDDRAENLGESTTKMIDWSLGKASGVIRSERTSINSKKSCVQFLAMSIQILDSKRVKDLSELLILPLFNLSENIYDEDDEKKVELQNLSLECLKMIENKIGISDYTQSYSNVRSNVSKIRQDRRVKRARLAITAPDVAARKKNRKHERTREKRKHEKDENGYYHTKKKRAQRN